MSEVLDLIKRQQPEIIDGFPTGNIFIGVTKEELTELEKEFKEHEQHKAIENELDIDLKLLPTLLKIKEGDKIYVIDGTLVKAEVTGNSLVNGRLMVFSHYGYKGIMYTPVCYYSEYGKTWALTKGELLCNTK